jgi:cytochrome c oxidase subunit 2
MLAPIILVAQAALAPAGLAAERLFDLFWWMAAGGIVIWLAFIGLAIYTLRARPESRNHGRANLLIIGGGVVIPTVVLGILLAYGLALLPDLLAPAPKGSLRIARGRSRSKAFSQRDLYRREERSHRSVW